MKNYKSLIWLISAMLLMSMSCENKEDEPSEIYKYSILIQSQVPLELSDNSEEEGTLVHGQYDLLSRTVLRMKEVMMEYESEMQTTDIEATLFRKCDSIYNGYASAYPQYSGQTICFVQLVRNKMVNGISREGKTLKTYYFHAFKNDNPNEQGDPSGISLDKPEALEIVDLGLSVFWANCNFGAKSPEEYGGYFGWGDPTGVLWSGDGIYRKAGVFVWETDNYGGKNPPTEIGGTSLDVVTTHWGNGWRTPSFNEAMELCRNCEWKLRSHNGRKWYEVIGPNGNSIIMPLGGIYGIISGDGSSVLSDGPYNTNSTGYYWTSTICDSPGTSATRGYAVDQGVATAWVFICASSRGDLTGLNMFNEHLRAFHFSIRPVYVEPEDIQPNQ